MAPVVAVRDLAYQYGDNDEVLSGITFSTHGANMLAVLGPSGVGKTTLLRVVAGLMPTSRGKVFINDNLYERISRHCILLDQELGLFKWLSVIDHIKFALPRPLKKYWRCQALELLDRVGLAGTTTRYPSELSGGMKQRLALARAFAARPSVLLLDEPFSALDVNSRLELEDLLCAVTFEMDSLSVIVTHDVREALYVADQVIILGGNPATVVDRVDVPFNRPRLPTLRGSEKFLKLQSDIELKIMYGGLNGSEKRSS